jgi:glucose/arabinose dehydrogenase
MGGLSSMALLRAAVSGNKVTVVERIDMKRRIRDVIQAPDGAVLLLVDGDNGELLRLTPMAQTSRR